MRPLASVGALMRVAISAGVGLLVAAVVGVGCSEGDGDGAASQGPTETPAPVEGDTAVATAQATATAASAVTPVPAWELPRGAESAGVLLLDYGPLEGWDSGRPGAARGALYPLAAGSGEMLPGYEPFDLGQASSELVSPDGRWLAVAYHRGQSSSSELRVFDLEGWREVPVEQLESAGTQHIGGFAWAANGWLAGLRYRGSVTPGFPWVLEAGGDGPRALIEPDVGDLDQWSGVQASGDGARLHVLGYRSAECCGIDVQGDPFLATFDLESGAELGRVALPGVLVGQRFETLFENEDEYNVLRSPAVVAASDGSLVYVVHADEDRVSVVDVAAGTVRVEAIERPRSVLSRLGGWLTSGLVSRAEAKGGVYRRKAATLSADGSQLYVTGVAEVACEGTPYFSCVDGRPLGLQVVDLESMELVAEFGGISRFVATSDGSRLVGIGAEVDYREVGPDEHGVRVGFGAQVIDTRSLEVVAHVEPETWFLDVAVSPDGRFAYLLSYGPGRTPEAEYSCREDCTLLSVVDLERGEVTATRVFGSGRLVSLSAGLSAAPWQ